MYKGCLNYNVLFFPPFQTRVVEEGMRDYKKGCLDKYIYVESILYSEALQKFDPHRHARVWLFSKEVSTGISPRQNMSSFCSKYIGHFAVDPLETLFFPFLKKKKKDISHSHQHTHQLKKDKHVWKILNIFPPYLSLYTNFVILNKNKKKYFKIHIYAKTHGLYMSPLHRDI